MCVGLTKCRTHEEKLDVKGKKIADQNAEKQNIKKRRKLQLS